MALARFKDLCIDVNVEAPMTAFWAAALGLRVDATHPDNAHLVGPTPQHTVWVNQVLEPRTVKQRVHLDLHAPSVAAYEQIGATVLPEWGPFPWTVMADPEGGEFCVFERDKPPAPRYAESAPSWESAERMYELCIDTAESEPIATWWADVFGARVQASDREFHWVEAIPGCPWESFVFLPVEEPKTVKNRIHWDVLVDDDESIAELCARGATILRRKDDEIGWTVMADPDGNEFCAFVETST